MSDLNIRALPAPEPGLHAFETRGKITKADVEWMAGVLKTAFDVEETVDILIVMRDYDGIEAGAVFDTKALSAQAQSAAHVRKYAVVGAPDWAETMINVLAPISPVEARTFDLEDEASAWAWVRLP